MKQFGFRCEMWNQRFDGDFRHIYLAISGQSKSCHHFQSNVGFLILLGITQRSPPLNLRLDYQPVPFFFCREALIQRSTALLTSSEGARPSADPALR